ncbi:MAG: hypothetical protein R3194_00225 [Limnobacter sp.]|nr:hypothetical protein [Limnobacter sp.]
MMVMNFLFPVIGTPHHHSGTTQKIKFTFVMALNTRNGRDFDLKKMILFMLCGLLQACSPPATKMVSETLSSDDRFKAVWVLMETFATDGFRYSLHLVPESLAVQCTPGRVFYFSNFSYVGETRLAVSLNTDCLPPPMN